MLRTRLNEKMMAALQILTVSLSDAQVPCSVLHQLPRGLILRSAEHLQLLLTSSGVLSVLHL